MVKMLDLHKIITQSNQNDLHNVFFVTSPIVAIITKMIINYFNIKSENIFIISFRNTDLSFLNYKSMNIEPGKYDRYLEKILFYSPSGNRIQKKLDHLKKDYIVYAPLAFREVNWVLSSNKCKGHIYIEEGQHSYMKISPYNHFKINLYNKIKKNWKNRFSETDEIGYYFRDDCLGYIGMLPEAYPMIPKQRKIILNNIQDLKKSYVPKLAGIKNVGITCASRRLEKVTIEDMLNKLLAQLPDQSVVKPHPSFTVNNKIFRNFKKSFDRISQGRVYLCSSDTILELEMLFEPKKLIGSKSSLMKYAKYLGSTYESVKLY